jgi:hypothetical protein
MIDKFTDTELNEVGRLLILDYEHGLEEKFIQRLIRADEVRRIQREDNMNPSTFIANLFDSVIAFNNESQFVYECDIYKVKGVQSRSLMLSMKSDKFITAVHMSARKIRKLFAACRALHTREELIAALRASLNWQGTLHSEINAEWINQCDINNRGELEILLKSYEQSELLTAKKEIANCLKKSW